MYNKYASDSQIDIVRSEGVLISTTQKNVSFYIVFLKKMYIPLFRHRRYMSRSKCKISARVRCIEM